MDSPLHRCRQIDDDDACFVGDAYALWGRVCKVHVTSKCYMFVERVIARLRVVVAVYLSLFFFSHRITFFFCGDKHMGKRKALWAFFVKDFFLCSFCAVLSFSFYTCATEEGN